MHVVSKTLGHSSGKLKAIQLSLIYLFKSKIEFNANNDEHKQINSNLENFIEQVAKTGTYM